jgi:hypothetical protein
LFVLPLLISDSEIWHLRSKNLKDSVSRCHNFHPSPAGSIARLRALRPLWMRRWVSWTETFIFEMKMWPFPKISGFRESALCQVHGLRISAVKLSQAPVDALDTRALYHNANYAFVTFPIGNSIIKQSRYTTPSLYSIVSPQTNRTSEPLPKQLLEELHISRLLLQEGSRSPEYICTLSRSIVSLLNF